MAFPLLGVLGAIPAIAGAVGGLVSIFKGKSKPAPVPVVQTRSQVGPSAFGGDPRFQTAVFRQGGATRTPGTRIAAGRVPALIGGAVGISVIGEILQLSREVTGRPVSAKKIRDAAKHCGIEIAANLFGISELQVCEVIISRPRRRRGISAADLRRTRATLRKVHTINHMIASWSPKGRARPRAHH